MYESRSASITVQIIDQQIPVVLIFWRLTDYTPGITADLVDEVALVIRLLVCCALGDPTFGLENVQPLVWCVLVCYKCLPRYANSLPIDLKVENKPDTPSPTVRYKPCGTKVWSFLLSKIKEVSMSKLQWFVKIITSTQKLNENGIISALAFWPTWCFETPYSWNNTKQKSQQSAQMEEHKVLVADELTNTLIYAPDPEYGLPATKSPLINMVFSLACKQDTTSTNACQTAWTFWSVGTRCGCFLLLLWRRQQRRTQPEKQAYIERIGFWCGKTLYSSLKSWLTMEKSLTLRIRKSKTTQGCGAMKVFADPRCNIDVQKVEVRTLTSNTLKDLVMKSDTYIEESSSLLWRKDEATNLQHARVQVCQLNSSRNTCLCPLNQAQTSAGSLRPCNLELDGVEAYIKTVKQRREWLRTTGRWPAELNKVLQTTATSWRSIKQSIEKFPLC